jgi:hypothetical protein
MPHNRNPVTFLLLLTLLSAALALTATREEPEVFPGADESTPSRSEYFSWINNTNEGATEAQTLVNLEFFRWLHDEYGMELDIYAFDAGALDGKRFYGRMDSARFKNQFPNGFRPLYEKAKAMGTRLGIWGGPDGFGDTPAEEQERTDQMVRLCRDFEFFLFKFDSVCGPLRPEKEEAFIRMMTECRLYSPDLILLNHRLGLERAQAHATTFLWEGKETYIDVFSTNGTTAPHHRADALSRGLVPGLKRLTEDHGVCLSSCLDYWEDDLILQAFNRALILAPQLYGSPWFLRDDEYPKLARIFNLHRKYRDILVSGIVLPEGRFGPHAVSRGDGETRLITLRNLTWEPVTYSIPLDRRIGLEAAERVHLRRFHPAERIYGDFTFGSAVEVEVAPFRSCLLLAATAPCDEPGILGADYEILRSLEGKPVLIEIKGLPGTRAAISLPRNQRRYKGAALDGGRADALLQGETKTVTFPGRPLRESFHRKLADLEPCALPGDAEALYEATAFAADSNALEVRTLSRSGPSRIPQVIEARQAFFSQDIFIKRGIRDRNLFDGDESTGFWPSRKYDIDQRVKGGCLRLDMGAVTEVDTIVLRSTDDFGLQPILREEGNHVEISADLESWERVTYMAGPVMEIAVPGPIRYLRFIHWPHRIMEIEGYKDGKPLSREGWRASNLLAHPRRMKAVGSWKAGIRIEEWVKNAYLCIAIQGEHGIEGAYAALKVGGEYIGCPDRAPSFPSNTWEYVNARRDRNTTYYVPLTKDMIGRDAEVYVLALEEGKTDLKPSVWLSAHPAPFETITLELLR